jgi:ABC-type proline/glycine betaine transport system ATPase subunit
LNSNGTTLIYTSHQLNEAEELCNTIALIDEGKIIAHNLLDNLLLEHKEDGLEGLFINLTGKKYRRYLMYKLGATILKDVRILTRDKLGLIFMFGMPILLAVVITAYRNSTFELVNDNKVPLLLCNRDTGEASKAIGCCY